MTDFHEFTISTASSVFGNPDDFFASKTKARWL
jgi:hypothetical protein